MRKILRSEAAKQGVSRRDFFVRAGAAAGGLYLAGMPGRTRGAGQDPPPITTNEPDNCAFVPQPTQAPIPFKPDPSLPLRHRKSAFSLQPDEIDKLKAAYKALRALPDTDPRSWIRQANVHCWYCGGGMDGDAGEEIHAGWWFFPWHRCYLYFHERILGSLIGDNTLALPYWDWDVDQHRTLPPPYTNPNDLSNPLYDDFRGVGVSDQLPLSAVGSQVMGPIMGSPDWSLFMGTQPDQQSNHGGNLENGPHGYVHLWAGKPSMYLPWGAPDMGVLATAAQDPVFFSHHANIDRLWDCWTNSDTAHTPPPFPAHAWTFYDEAQQWRSISVSDVLSPGNLNYVYDTLCQTAAPRTIAMIGGPEKTPLGTEPVTKKAELTPEQLQQLTRPSRPRYTLHIDGVEVPSGQAANVRVFLNLDSATAKTSTEDSHFVGYFVVVPMARRKAGAMAHMKKHRPLNYAFDVTSKIAAGINLKDGVAVTLVPVGADDNKPAAMNVTYEKVYLKRND